MLSHATRVGRARRGACVGHTVKRPHMRVAMPLSLRCREFCGVAAVRRGHPATFRASSPRLIPWGVVLSLVVMPRTRAQTSPVNTLKTAHIVNKVMYTRDHDGVTGVATAQTSTLSMATASAAFAECGGVVRRVSNSHCAQCLEEINATTGFPHSFAEVGSTPPTAPTESLTIMACSTNVARGPGHHRRVCVDGAARIRALQCVDMGAHCTACSLHTLTMTSPSYTVHVR